jgi:hypothetical protein
VQIDGESISFATELGGKPRQIRLVNNGDEKCDIWLATFDNLLEILPWILLIE